MTKSVFLVHEQVYPVPNKPTFRIIETYFSCDGPRTRLTHQVFNTNEEAQAKCKELNND